MNEPFRFKRLMTLPQGWVEQALRELQALDGWRVHSSSTLGTAARQSVALRGHPDYPPSGIAPQGMVGTCRDTAAFGRCPATRELVNQVMRDMQCSELGLATVSRTVPGGAIAPHIDGGAYFSHYHRIQIPLSAGPGITFTCEEETVVMAAGEVWCFDNKRVHSVRNAGTVERINLYFDTR